MSCRYPITAPAPWQVWYTIHMLRRKEKHTDRGGDIFKELSKAKDADGAEKKEDDKITGDGQLTVDVYRDGDDIVIESAIAGIDPDTDLDVNIKRDAVEIRGERERSKSVSDRDYYYQECFWGTFSRMVILPEEIDPDASKASFENGILTIRMPLLKSKKKGKKVKVATN